ncbi:MAG TPA: acetylornithine deacetylase [Stellaceae bacterium]|nr:acetylornithine deacetylase [Stellaceae bacterium]
MSTTPLSDRQLLDRLIGFDTVSAKSNMALIEWVADYLDGLGVRSELTHDDTGGKANLYAAIGPDGPGGVVLSGHTDVVPVADQAWTADPFTVVERDGLLFGRGTADMKAFIALALAAVPKFKATPLRIPVHLAFSYDEEVGCLGVHRLIDALPTGDRRPRLAIIGEPTSMAIINAHKGGMVFRTTVTGLEGHSSAPHKGVSAIFAATEIIQTIARIAERHRRQAKPDCPFEPPYTTFNVGTIQGGTAGNIIARSCTFLWEYRPIPGDDPNVILAEIQGFIDQDLLPRMRRIHPGSDVATEELMRLRGLAPEPDGEAEALVRHLTGGNRSGVVAFGTEAGLFQAAGMSAVVCGPGSIDQAHKPDEFISLEQFAAGGQFMSKLATWLQPSA